ncbi:MAG: hypothetical protein ACKPKO_47490, partial [Candidatus Fonsibacter sp.]
MQRNLGVSHASLADGLRMSSLIEFGYPFSDRTDTFNGFALACLDIQLPEDATIMVLPALPKVGLECGHSGRDLHSAQRPLHKTPHPDLGYASLIRLATASVETGLAVSDRSCDTE